MNHHAVQDTASHLGGASRASVRRRHGDEVIAERVRKGHADQAAARVAAEHEGDIGLVGVVRGWLDRQFGVFVAQRRAEADHAVGTLDVGALGVRGRRREAVAAGNGKCVVGPQYLGTFGMSRSCRAIGPTGDGEDVPSQVSRCNEHHLVVHADAGAQQNRIPGGGVRVIGLGLG
jgi:hypothetical protein